LVRAPADDGRGREALSVQLDRPSCRELYIDRPAGR
jgi:hypothetical protein